MKICTNPDCHKAGEPQPLDNFHRKAYGLNRTAKCKICVNSARRKSGYIIKQTADARKKKQTEKQRLASEADIFNQANMRW